ncbi:MAG: pilus assembly protein PilY [Burkholderiales bacterium PBB5]|nr:MAG: pilus assembly protein PilY [Burkholderiales bacterium PBB5]
MVSAAALLGLALCPALTPAQTISFAQSPLFLGTTVKPNVLVVMDNSQSMDGTMAGKLIAGDDPSTRGNIARSVLRSTITSYRTSFQWGLASFGLRSSGLYTTYPYYFGNETEVVYTNDCVSGISASKGGLRCVANPEPGNGYDYLTYARSGDDPSINDVLYYSDIGTQMYGLGVSGSTNYEGYYNHRSSGGASWDADKFRNGAGTLGFTPTDAGFLPGTFPGTSNYYPRIFWLRRAWGYNGNITGKGVVNEALADDSSTHFTNLMSLLASETNSSGSGELKNAAVFTPLAGTLDTVKDYYAGSLSGSAPITQSCQRNFVLLATDGNPTGKTDGSMYSLSEMANTYNAATGLWSFGTAASDVFSRVTALRSTSYGGKSYDVQTYVIGLGDSVANASSVAALNRFAALGGTDSAYLASDSAALSAAFRAISVDIIARTAAASSVSLNSGSWSTTSKVYQGRFSSGDWSGQLLAFPLTSSGSPAATPDWDAGQVINGQNWNTGRQILTYKPSAALGSRGVAFRWPATAASPGAAEMDLAMVTALNKDSTGAVDGYGAQRLEFLRGNAAREERNCISCSAPVFRSRAISVLGDIINSAPAYVGGATGDYRDTMEAGRYSTYAAGRASLAPIIYVGANDGMLHGFNAASGAEVFAYVPYAVRNRLSGLTSSAYVHAYSADGSPAVGDVYYGSAWHTLLVAGMNAGAPGLYALDITTPAYFTEAQAARVVRWEVGDSDGDVGYIFGRPIITKTRDGRWRAIVGNGYNSANGHAVLLLVDVETGAVTKVDTGVGTSGSPNGLSAVTVVSSNDNGVADLVYAGDLKGNLWKFDISSSSPGSWKVANGAATPLFTAASGQAITARPGVTRFPKGGYLVAFGTGRYIDIADNGTTGTQALYGIWDNGSSTVALSDLQTQTVVSTATGADSNTYRLTTHAVGPATDTPITGDNAISLASYYSSKKGWKMTLPSSGERVVAEATIRFGRVVVSTLVPSTAVCSFGGDGWIMDLDVITGNRSPALDTNGDNKVDATDYLGATGGSSGTMAGGVRVGAVPAAASIMRSSDKKLDDKLINTSAGSIVRVRETGKRDTSGRAAWEQLK